MQLNGGEDSLLHNDHPFVVSSEDDMGEIGGYSPDLRRPSHYSNPQLLEDLDECIRILEQARNRRGVLSFFGVATTVGSWFGCRYGKSCGDNWHQPLTSLAIAGMAVPLLLIIGMFYSKASSPGMKVITSNAEKLLSVAREAGIDLADQSASLTVVYNRFVSKRDEEAKALAEHRQLPEPL